MSWNDQETTEDDLEVRSLNRAAVVGLITSFFLAMAGLFVLPAFEIAGLGSRGAFWLVLAVEFVAALGVGISARKLYT